MLERELLDGGLKIYLRDGFVEVWHSKAAKTVEETDAIMGAIDEVLEKTGQSLLLFDSRESERTPPEVGKRIWAWLEGNPRLRRVATLLESENLAVSVRMSGIAHAVKIKAFHTRDDAVAFLTYLG